MSSSEEAIIDVIAHRANVTEIQRRPSHNLPERLRERSPFIFSGALDNWDAKKWCPAYLKQKLGPVPVTAHINLPEHGVPYFWDEGAYRVSMSMRELLERIEAAPEMRCYIAQKNIELFDILKQDFHFDDLLPAYAPKSPVTSVWIGTRATRSGLHFDRRDNLFVQVYGSKLVLLAAPEEVTNLHPLKDMFEKSAVDPVEPDYSATPRFRDAKLSYAVLGPGDTLFIPRLWWHYLRSVETTISLSYWFGPEISMQSWLKMLSGGGIQHWLVNLRDAFWYGLCKRPFQTRYRSDMPSGVLLYRFIEEGMRRRWPARRRTDAANPDAGLTKH